MKLSRRRLLQVGLAVGAASTVGGQANLAQTRALSGSGLSGSGLSGSEVSRSAGSGPTLRQLAQTDGYSAPISELLVRCCDLAGEQYHRSQGDPTYDGDIQALGEYRTYAAWLNPYQQIQSFRLPQPSFASLAAIAGLLNPAAAPSTSASSPDAPSTSAPSASVPRSGPFGLTNLLWGYALTSSSSNIIALRGTQTEAEMAVGAHWLQVAFGPRSSRVHAGFHLIYQGLIDQLRQAAEQFDPDLPCYITGYSLGGAVAVLTAATLAESPLKSQLRVYTYAMPRLGNPAFARFYNRLVPHTYRIVNQADWVPTLPPEQIQGSTYSDVGEAWFYYSQCGSFDRNHAISTYRRAVDQGLQQAPQAEPSNHCS